MKNSIRKIAAVLSASILAALPMANSFSANATTIAPPHAPFYFGNVDCNYKLDLHDALTVLQWASGPIPSTVTADQRRRADVDGDGNISQADAQAVLEAYTELHVAQLDILGDLNGNNKRDSADVVIVYQYLFGQTETINRIRADVNMDGQITPIDALVINDNLNG